MLGGEQSQPGQVSRAARDGAKGAGQHRSRITPGDSDPG
jgi:hypothetical protein